MAKPYIISNWSEPCSSIPVWMWPRDISVSVVRNWKMPSRRMSVLAKINSKIKDNFLSLHPIWHFASRMQFSFILPVRNVCVDKMDYLFRECAVTGVTAVTAVTIWVGVTNPLTGNMVCIKCLETSQLVNLHRWKYEGFGVWLKCLFLLEKAELTWIRWYSELTSRHASECFAYFQSDS